MNTITRRALRAAFVAFVALMPAAVAVASDDGPGHPRNGFTDQVDDRCSAEALYSKRINFDRGDIWTVPAPPAGYEYTNIIFADDNQRYDIRNAVVGAEYHLSELYGENRHVVLCITTEATPSTSSPAPTTSSPASSTTSPPGPPTSTTAPTSSSPSTSTPPSSVTPPPSSTAPSSVPPPPPSVSPSQPSTTLITPQSSSPTPDDPCIDPTTGERDPLCQPLPATGNAPGTTALIALILLAVGGALALLAARRRVAA